MPHDRHEKSSSARCSCLGPGWRITFAYRTLMLQVDSLWFETNLKSQTSFNQLHQHVHIPTGRAHRANNLAFSLDWLESLEVQNARTVIQNMRNETVERIEDQVWHTVSISIWWNCAGDLSWAAKAKNRKQKHTSHHQQIQQNGMSLNCVVACNFHTQIKAVKVTSSNSITKGLVKWSGAALSKAIRFARVAGSSNSLRVCCKQQQAKWSTSQPMQARSKALCWYISSKWWSQVRVWCKRLLVDP